MAKTARTLTTALAVSATLLTARGATASDAAARATIVLHVDDFSGLPADDLNAAVTVAGRIFASAGIRTIWVYGRDRAPRADGALHLTVLVLSKKMAERKIANDLVDSNVLGQAASSCGRAYILSHRIKELATRNERRVGDLLGRVVAHEVGHLLLPENGHSPTGIMTSSLDLNTTALVAFTSEQTAAIRVRVASAN